MTAERKQSELDIIMLKLHHELFEGFTITEWLVITVIRGYFLGLIWPAIEAARKAARRMIADVLKKIAGFDDLLDSFLKWFEQKFARDVVLESSADWVSVGAHSFNRIQNGSSDKHHVLSQNGEPIISLEARAVAMDRPNTFRVFGSFRFYCSEGIRWLSLAKRVVKIVTKKIPAKTASGGRRIMKVGSKGLLPK